MALNWQGNLCEPLATHTDRRQARKPARHLNQYTTGAIAGVIT